MSVEVLEIELFSDPLVAAVSELVRLGKSGGKRENRLVSATGAHGLVQARRDPGFRRVLKKFFWNLPDGKPAVWVGRLKGAKQMERCYGPTFFEEVMRATAATEMTYFLCGGKEGVAERLAEACRIRFGNNNCVGTFSPPFREMEDDEMETLAARINKSGSTLVWIGLSTPKQEIFAHRLAHWTKVHFIITVGAAFDFHIGELRQAPPVLQRAGLEWLFRLAIEPRRLFGRYIEIVPLFIYYNIKEFLNIDNKKEE